jgi:hypothetical protein
MAQVMWRADHQRLTQRCAGYALGEFIEYCSSAAVLIFTRRASSRVLIDTIELLAYAAKSPDRQMPLLVHSLDRNFAVIDGTRVCAGIL